MDGYLEALLFQLRNQHNTIFFPADEQLNVLSPSYSLLIGIMRTALAAKKKASTLLFFSFSQIFISA